MCDIFSKFLTFQNGGGWYIISEYVPLPLSVKISNSLLQDKLRTIADFDRTDSFSLPIKPKKVLVVPIHFTECPKKFHKSVLYLW